MTAQMIPARGRVYMADLGYGDKPFLVVSNNARNTKLEDCVAVRITTTQKPEIASIVPLSGSDPLVGRVLCDDIVRLYRDELRRDVGALSVPTMNRVGAALRYALAI
ncbi:MAG TPA: MazF family transcriptional regulator [Micromonosporaceae bacterium]|nr:MazF family transcriptional regulator [Micromonosporaceae bacterium]HCU49883.1 MazF family transcriptional regulator [Micromonosporaceae bacterium]